MKKPAIKKAWVVLVILALYAYLAYRLVDFEQWEALQQIMAYQTSQLARILLLQLALLAINLLLESLKWRFILRPIKTISITEAISTTLTAMALGNITPARTGEHVGRIAWLPRHQRSLTLALSLLSSMVQTVVIVVALGLSLPFIIGKPTHALDWTSMGRIILTLLAVGLLVLATTILLARTTSIGYKLRRIRLLFARKIINLRYLSVTLSLSMLRYMVFATQLAIMLHAFQPDMDVRHMVALIPAYYFCITVIPSIFLADIGIKGSVALFVFAGISNNELSTLTAMFIIWLVNSAIPTLLGNFIITQKQIKKHYSPFK